MGWKNIFIFVLPLRRGDFHSHIHRNNWPSNNEVYYLNMPFYTSLKTFHVKFTKKVFYFLSKFFLCFQFEKMTVGIEWMPIFVRLHWETSTLTRLKRKSTLHVICISPFFISPPATTLEKSAKMILEKIQLLL